MTDRTRIIAANWKMHKTVLESVAFIKEFRKLADAVPPGLAAFRDDLERNFRAVLQGGLAKLDLVTREARRTFGVEPADEADLVEQVLGRICAEVEDAVLLPDLSR